ncbi:MAG: hypothetical protein U5M53_03365 [Rhodoferax sp.]|nr:hypothetical protein [Rhodoferax sp.]
MHRWSTTATRIQVDVQGRQLHDRARLATTACCSFTFTTPSEEQVNYQRSAMVAHPGAQRNDEGQLAVVAVLLEPGRLPTPLIDKVWTYMPLEVNDRVRMPRDAAQPQRAAAQRPALLPVHGLADHATLHRRRVCGW